MPDNIIFIVCSMSSAIAQTKRRAGRFKTDMLDVTGTYTTGNLEAKAGRTFTLPPTTPPPPFTGATFVYDGDSRRAAFQGMHRADRNDEHDSPRN